MRASASPVAESELAGHYNSSIGRPQQGIIGGVGMTTAAPDKRLVVTVIGAGGGIGQTCSLFLKCELPAGSKLRMYDVAPMVAGVAADVSHVDTPVSLEAFPGEMGKRGCPNLQKALTGCDIIAVTAGFPRKPGMTRADLFDKNAQIVRDIVEVIAHVAPNAILCICTNPVNALIPLAAEILKAKGVYNKDRLFGVTLLDNMRACHFFNDAIDKGGDLWDSTSIQPVKEVPVIGGHSEDSIVPLFSVVGSRAFGMLNEQAQRDLYQKVREAGSTVVKAKAGRGSATLSMGVANAYFVVAIANALIGKQKATICAMIDTNGYADVPFMAWPVRLNDTGIDSRLRLPKISPHEAKLLDEALPILRKDAEKGKKWIKDNPDLWSPGAAVGGGADAPRWSSSGNMPKEGTFSSTKAAKQAQQAKL